MSKEWFDCFGNKVEGSKERQYPGKREHQEEDESDQLLDSHISCMEQSYRAD